MISPNQSYITKEGHFSVNSSPRNSALKNSLAFGKKRRNSHFDFKRRNKFSKTKFFEVRLNNRDIKNFMSKKDALKIIK
jgi:type VI protein secretion system component Hcp